MEWRKIMNLSLPEKIRKYRQLRNLTQKELGILCDFPEKSADSRIREFESGKTQPKREILQKIADSLNISILELMDIKFERTNDLLYVLRILEEKYYITPKESNELPICDELKRNNMCKTKGSEKKP